MASGFCTSVSPDEADCMIDPVKVQALLDGLGFINLTQEDEYAVYANRYLMREAKDTHARVFYDQYRALGGMLTISEVSCIS